MKDNEMIPNIDRADVTAFDERAAEITKLKLDGLKYEEKIKIAYGVCAIALHIKGIIDINCKDEDDRVILLVSMRGASPIYWMVSEMFEQITGEDFHSRINVIEIPLGTAVDWNDINTTLGGIENGQKQVIFRHYTDDVDNKDCVKAFVFLDEVQKGSVLSSHYLLFQEEIRKKFENAKIYVIGAQDTNSRQDLNKNYAKLFSDRRTKDYFFSVRFRLFVDEANSLPLILDYDRQTKKKLGGPRIYETRKGVNPPKLMEVYRKFTRDVLLQLISW